MPFVVRKLGNNHRVHSGVEGRVLPFVFTAAEIDNLRRDPKNCYLVVNTTTRRKSHVGGACPKRRKRRR